MDVKENAQALPDDFSITSSAMASREGDTERPSILVVSALPTLYALLVMRLLSARSGGLLHPNHPGLMGALALRICAKADSNTFRLSRQLIKRHRLRQVEIALSDRCRMTLDRHSQQILCENAERFFNKIKQCRRVATRFTCSPPTTLPSSSLHQNN